MTSREAMLATIRAAQPVARPLPEVPRFASIGGDLRERFVKALALMNGDCIELESGAHVDAWIRERFGADVSIASATPEVQGTRALDATTEPASLHDVDIGVVRARFGVAHTGSVFLSEREYVVNSLGYLVQHLVILLDPAQLVDDLPDVYARGDFLSARYAVLVTGPSATADIEGVLVRGAQGVRSLTVVWLKG